MSPVRSKRLGTPSASAALVVHAVLGVRGLSAVCGLAGAETGRVGDQGAQVGLVLDDKLRVASGIACCHALGTCAGCAGGIREH